VRRARRPSIRQPSSNLMPIHKIFTVLVRSSCHPRSRSFLASSFDENGNRIPSSAAQWRYASNRSPCGVRAFAISHVHSAMKSESTSCSLRYSLTANCTIFGGLSPSACQSRQPRMAQFKIPEASSRNLSPRRGSSFVPSNVRVKGISRTRRQIPQSVPRIVGLWFP
jgi:hypothetical protein